MDKVSPMKAIDVTDLPENVVRTLEDQAQHARRRQLLTRQNRGPAPEPLPQWPGVVVSPEKLRREEL